MAAVAFDAVGPSSAGYSSTSALTSGSWTHTAGTGANCVLAFVSVGTNGDPTSGITVTATYGGSSMTQLGVAGSGAAAGFTQAGAVWCFGITTGSSGANTVAFSVSGASHAQAVTGGSLSFTGGAAFGRAVTASSNGEVASGSVSVSSTANGNMVAAGVADGSGGEAWTAGTQQYLADVNSNTGASNSTAATLASSGGTVTLSWTEFSDIYGVVAVEVQAPVAAQAGYPGLGSALPSPTWREQFRPYRRWVQVPQWKPDAYGDTDLSAAAESDPSAVALADTDLSTGSDASVIAATAADSDSSTGTDAGELFALAAADASTGTDNGTVLRYDFMTGSALVSRTWTERFRPQPWGRKLQLPQYQPLVYADADLSTSLDAGETVVLADTDAGHGTDAGEQVQSFDFTVGQALVSRTWTEHWRPRPKLQAPVFLPPPAAVTVTDTDAARGTEALGAVNADFAHGEDSGFTALAGAEGSTSTDTGVLLPSDLDDSPLARDLELTAWPSDADSGGTSTLFTSSGESEYWSGPLADRVPDTGHGTDGPTPVIFQMADTETGTGTDGHIIGVYSFQPLFRFTGGQFELRAPHPDTGEQLLLWRGARPDGTALRLQALHAAGRLRFAADADAARARDYGDAAASLPVTVRLGPVLVTALEVS